MSTPRCLNASRERFEVWARLFPELGLDDPLPSADTWLRTQGPETFFAELAGELVGYGCGQVRGAHAARGRRPRSVRAPAHARTAGVNRLDGELRRRAS